MSDTRGVMDIIIQFFLTIIDIISVNKTITVVVVIVIIIITSYDDGTRTCLVLCKS